MIKIHNADCLDILKAMKDNSIDSIVTDPPAGISFMGKDWDDNKGSNENWIFWLTEIMKECNRVLKPGAHALVWAIPKTSHRTGQALENAGFEVRDIITHLFGQGFPKSLNISKQLDKMAGAEREVIAINPNKRNAHIKGAKGFDKALGGKKLESMNITAPNTPEAKQFDGYGTALKPAVEFWYLVRKPLSEKSVALNVLKWNTGGLNIDACRIGNEQREYSINGATKGGNFGNGANQNAKDRDHKIVQGRFPSNLVLSHHEECEENQCHSECAVYLLDEQSGVLRSRDGYNKENELIDNSHTKKNSWHLENKMRNTSRNGELGGGFTFFLLRQDFYK